MFVRHDTDFLPLIPLQRGGGFLWYYNVYLSLDVGPQGLESVAIENLLVLNAPMQNPRLY